MGVADRGALDTFLAEPRNAIVIGLRPDGSPHATPNWFLWEDGRFYVSTTTSRAKFRIFTNDPRAQLVVDDSMGFRYVMIDARVEVSEDIDTGLPYFERLRAKHGAGGATRAMLRAEMERDGRVTLVIAPTADPRDWPALGF